MDRLSRDRRYFSYLRWMPVWGLEARRRLRLGELSKSTSKPDATEPESEQLIWIAATHPVPYWLVTAAGWLILIIALVIVAFVVSALISG